jgi:hypothetical protein
MLKFSATFGASGTPGSTLGFFADDGSGVSSAAACTYPVMTPGRTFINLRVVNINAGFAAPATVRIDLLKNGVATALTLLFTGPVAAGAQMEIIGSVVYAAGDTFDLRAVTPTGIGVGTRLSATIGVSA